jgi:hypothetical protein
MVDGRGAHFRKAVLVCLNVESYEVLEYGVDYQPVDCCTPLKESEIGQHAFSLQGGFE